MKLSPAILAALRLKPVNWWPYFVFLLSVLSDCVCPEGRAPRDGNYIVSG